MWRMLRSEFRFDGRAKIYLDPAEFDRHLRAISGPCSPWRGTRLVRRAIIGGH
jgi:hypothetical protein